MGPAFRKRDSVIFIGLVILCCPIFGSRWVAEKLRDIITGKKPPQPYKRPPLLPRRPLTPPLQEDPSQLQSHGNDQGESEGKRKRREERNPKDQDAPTPTPQFNTQSQSILFRLPLEVRVMIYREILSFPIPLRVRAGSGNQGLYTDRKDPRHKGDFNWSVLGLLACCRRVYSESIHLLYETNVLTFVVFESFSSILKLPMYIIPSRLRSFRSIQLYMFLHPGGVSRSEVIWRQVCEALETMTGLHRVVVQLEGHEGVVDVVPCLEAMARIRAPDFRVFVHRELSIQGGPNHEVFPCGTPFVLFRENSEGKWKPWTWRRSVVS